MSPRMLSLGVCVVIAVVARSQATCDTAAADDFGFRDNDTVVFLGDSITAARGYTKIIEHYTLMRFPEREVVFYNAGKGGDTAQSSINRLQREVFDRDATVMLIALGVNDIGWGMKADIEHKQQHLAGVRALITQCQERGVRVYFCGPAITAEASEKAEVGFLQEMADEGLALTKSLGAGAIDLQRGMRAIQKGIETANAAEADATKHVRLHADDGVHLNDLGQLAMAYAILKGLGAPDVVSSARIDFQKGKVLELANCEIVDLHKSDQSITFTRLDAGLPLNRGTFSALDYRWIPIPDGLNRYLLQIDHLPSGKYSIEADGRPVHTVTADELARGINMASMTADPWQPGGPWNVQSDIVKELVDARDKLLQAERLEQAFESSRFLAPAGGEAYKSLDVPLIQLQRQTARPRPYAFEIIRIGDN